MDEWVFDLGNPQEDAPRRVEKKKSKKKVLLMATVAGVVLAIVLVVALWNTTGFDSLRRSVIYARAEKDANGCAQLYDYAAEKSGCFASLDGGLVIASEGQVTLMGEDGGVRYHEMLKFRKADVVSNGALAAVYDIGGTEIYVLDSHGLVRQMACEGEILALQMNRDGWLTVTLNKSGYKAAAYVYNSKGELIFEFNSADRFVMTAATANNNNCMAAVTMGQSEGAFVSSVMFYKLNSEERYAACDLPGGAVYDLGVVGGSYCAVAENALHFLQTNGNLTGSFDFEGHFLRRCSLRGDGFAALLLSDYRSGSQGRLVTVNEKGEQIAMLEIDSEVLSLTAAGRYTAVLYSDRLVIYDKQLRECATLQDISIAKQALMRKDGSALLVGTSAASLYLP